MKKKKRIITKFRLRSVVLDANDNVEKIIRESPEFGKDQISVGIYTLLCKDAQEWEYQELLRLDSEYDLTTWDTPDFKILEIQIKYNDESDWEYFEDPVEGYYNL